MVGLHLSQQFCSSLFLPHSKCTASWQVLPYISSTVVHITLVRCSAFSMLSTMVSPSCSSQQLQKAALSADNIALSADNIALSADKTQQSNGKKVQCSQQRVFPSDKLGQFWISVREDLNHFYRRVVILDFISLIQKYII